MIPAPRGLVARYKHTNPDHHTHKPIVAFDDEGRPLIVHDEHHRLAPASTYRNFDGIDEDPYSDIVAIMPSGGWRVAYTTKDGDEWSEPLVGWGLKASGSVVPLETDATGYVDDFDLHSDEYRIYHPDADRGTTQTPAASAAADNTRRTT